jgi:hypothetical protein
VEPSSFLRFIREGYISLDSLLRPYPCLRDYGSRDHPLQPKTGLTSVVDLIDSEEHRLRMGIDLLLILLFVTYESALLPARERNSFQVPSS